MLHGQQYSGWRNVGSTLTERDADILTVRGYHLPGEDDAGAQGKQVLDEFVATDLPAKRLSGSRLCNTESLSGNEV